MKRILICLLSTLIGISSFLPLNESFAAYATEDITTAQVIFEDSRIHAAASYTLEVKDEDGNSYVGTKKEIGSTGQYQTVYELPVRKGDSYYTYSLIPNDPDKYWGSSGKFYVYQYTDFTGLNLSDAGGFYVYEKKTIDVEVPTGANIKHCMRGKFYYALQETQGELIETVNGYDKYRFGVPISKGTIMGHFEIRKENNVTWAGSESDLKLVFDGEIPTYRLESMTEGSQKIYRDEESQGFYEAGILLNGPSNKLIELNTGEYFDIYAFRAWQAIESETGNYYVDPDFHYEVVYGNSVNVNNEGRITAVSDGMSIVKVTYDALDWTSSRKGRMTYSACWPEKQGIYVVNVNGKESDIIDTGIKLSEYDTIYYISSQNDKPTGIDYAEYTFTPSSKNGEQISVTVGNPTLSDSGLSYDNWRSYEANKDGSYTVKLTKGRNVIKVSTESAEAYHVVNADDLDIQITNKYRPGENLMQGDRAVITFEGMTTPIPKMAAIYNPAGYSVVYSYGNTEIKTFVGQYDLSRNAKVEVDVTEPGKIVLNKGYLTTGVWGDTEALPSMHQRMQKGGCVLNRYWDGGDNAQYNAGRLCILPDIELDVADNKDIEEQNKLDAGLLTSVYIGTKSGSTNQLGNSSAEDLKLKNNFIKWLTKMGPKLPLNNKPLYIKAIAKNQNAEITVQCKNGKDTIKKTISSDVEQQIISDDNKTFLNSPNITEIEITVDPGESGYKKTYSFTGAFVVDGQKSAYLKDFDIAAVNDKFAPGEILFEAVHEEDENIGYGFLSTRTTHNVTIPGRINAITATAALTGTDGKSYGAGEAIPLETGKNSFTTIVKANKGDKTKTYTFNFIKENMQKIIFNSDNGIELKIKNSQGRKISANEDGSYTLAPGSYRYIAEKSGYITRVGNFEVTSGEDKTVTIPALEKLAKQSGNVSVEIIGADSYIKQKTTIAISEPDDLAAYKYVEYNHGGYTVLHSLIDALNSGISKAEFRCIKGELVPIIDLTGTTITNASDWVCEVNGKICTEPANTLVRDGDVIEYYYNPAYEGMQFAKFKEGSQMTVTQGESLKLTLLSKTVGTNGDMKACADATIYVNGTAIESKTVENGTITIPAEKISQPGTVIITASKLNESQKNLLTYCACTVTVKKTPTGGDPNKTTVSFRLIGDGGHDGISEHEKYITWIATKSYTFDKKSVSVYEVFMRALNDAGLSQDGANNNYVKSIKAPTAYGGYWLGEFANGKNSGWMYTVNGEHPLFGLKDYYVTNGDSIVWHYVDDYKLETSFEGSIPTYPNRWLEAEDTDPPTDKVIDMSGKGKAKDVTTSGAAGSATTTAPTEVKVSGSTATATIKAEDQSEILKQATENKSAEIVLEVAASDTKGAENVQLQLETSFVKNISDKTNASLILDTENGRVSFDQEALKAIIGEAKGSTIIIEIAKVTKPTEAQKKAAGTNGDIFRLVVKSGDKIISDFNKGKATVRVEIPAKLTDKKVAAIYIADDAKIEQLAGKVLTIGGKKYYEFTTPHFSTFALVDAEELGLEVKEEPQVDAKALTAKLTPVARSAKTAKKNVKVTVSLDKQDKAIIKELKDAGYTVKYRFYRSTKKAAGYKAAITKKTASYTNTSGKKGTKYFYKIQIRVYDENGKLVAKTALKQCKYASRIWTR